MPIVSTIIPRTVPRSPSALKMPAGLDTKASATAAWAAVRTVASGETMLAPRLVRRLLDRFVQRPPDDATAQALAGLTDREREVAGLVGRGLSNQEVAGTRFLSEATVKTYVSRLLGKIGLRSIACRSPSSRTRAG
jgi:DNA-binding NarL/FixJ family response regulator